MSDTTTENSTQPTEMGAKEDTQTEKQASEAASKTGDSKDGLDAAPISPHRLKMVELATQLVSAQIAASASYRIALDLAREQCDMIKDLSKQFLSGGKPEGGDKKTEGGDIFGMAGYSMISIRKPRELKPLSFGEFDELFESAMYRVQGMLKSPVLDKRVVYAEQLFVPEEILSENRIWQRFEEYRWPGLTGRDSVIDLMTKVDSLFSSHFKFLKTPVSPAEASQKIKQFNKLYQEEIEILSPAWELCRKNSGDRFDSHRKRFLVAADSIENLINLRRNEAYENFLPPISSDRDSKLIVRMYNGSEPRPREQDEVGESSSGKKKSTTRNYWPWGIFRYLRLHGKTYPSLDGHGLNLKLKTEMRNLNPDMVFNIARVESEEYNFGPLGASVNDSDPLLEGGGVEEEMDLWMNAPPCVVTQSEVE